MRNAMGAVTFLCPFMILVRVLGGSPMAMAALLALIPASRSASANASPGWIGGSFSVVIRDFDILRLVVRPAKTNSIPIINSDTVLAGSISRKLFEP
jgi:hypothetical protein